jgi:AP-1 complex subunit mu
MVYCGSSQVLVEYFKELEEESIRDNFVIIYELLDEMMDFGYPQTTESKILQELVAKLISLTLVQTREIRYITQESHKLEIQARPPAAVTNAVSWRSEGIRYRKNEVFLDVIESVNLLVITLCWWTRVQWPIQYLHATGQRQRKRRSVRNPWRR